ncbi:MAG: 4-hydroxybenzoyl-CoA reductase [Myxococcales bacterium]|nr:4-hydroxybenzoyl-CoA reductase [Myxococcales bacterium]
MMRCPPFSYRAPTTVDEAVRILAGEGPRAMLLAGGTDLVPNMKRRQQTPPVLVSLRRVAGLREVTADGASVTVGAGLTLAQLAAHPLLRPWTAFGRAADSVATPHIRNAGTLGGNLCLDTRCNYYDQNYEWRKAIDFCMKRGEGGDGWAMRNDAPQGSVCWVAPGSKRCWAVSSTDSAPALIALGAEVTLCSTAGKRTIPLADLYRDDGIDYLAKRPDELLSEVRLGDPSGWRSTYWKLRRREAFDFPVLSVAAAVKLASDGTVLDARLVFGAVASHPVVALAAQKLVGARLTDEAIDAVAAEASKHAKPLDNTDFSLGWRKRVAKAYVAGALRELRGDDPSLLGPHARRAAALRPF